jgi:hypothetical protein
MSVTQRAARLGERLGEAVDAALADAVSREMKALAGRLGEPDPPPPLHWRCTLDPIGRVLQIVGLVASDCEHRRVPAILAQWANLLGLQPTAGGFDGTLHYAGHFDGCPLSIWGVIDGVAWRRAMTMEV